MKTAVTDNGVEVLAAEGAPQEALCPACGQVVTLRMRRLMNDGGVTYFWRHNSGGRKCPARATFAIRGGKRGY